MLAVGTCLLLAGCIDSGGGNASPSPVAGEPAATPNNDGGINITNIDADETTITITYTQPVKEEPEDVYAAWAQLFGDALGEAQNPEKIRSLAIICNFDDGEIMRVSTDPETVTQFLNEEIDAWEFLYALDMEPHTKGPRVWEG